MAGITARYNSQKDMKGEENEPSVHKKVKDRLNICLSGLDDNHSRSGCSIYVVPGRLRRGNEQAYTPRVISIGPVHHGAEHLQAMESNKLRYVSAFLNRLPYHSSDFIEIAQKNWEKGARDCYQNILQFSSDEFISMILIDGIFIVELLMRNFYENMREKDDIFQKQWLRIELHHDMILLENQLPFFIVEDLFSIAATYLGLKDSIADLAYKYFDFDNSNYRAVNQANGEVNHILDLFCRLFSPKERRRGETEIKDSFQYTRSAAELHAAGVEFAKVRSDQFSQVDISFTNGTLEIPPLRVDERTEALFRNLIAYEQCHRDDSIISSYIILMDILINTPKDVHVLTESKVIENSLGELEDVCFLFNNLYKRTTMDSGQFYYARICKELNEFSIDCWHQLKADCYRWMKIFKRDYLSSPWKFISVIAAVILLVLTVIQTVCSIWSVNNG